MEPVLGLDRPYYLADVDEKQMMDQRLPKRCQKISDEQGKELWSENKTFKTSKE
jgi:hypothetical protein